METLGHSPLAMTLHRYAHIFQEAQKETADKMGKGLSGEGAPPLVAVKTYQRLKNKAL